MRILNYGSINVDHVYKVTHIVRPGETLSSRELSFFAGGKGANQSVALSRAGIEVWHAGKIGEDGRWILEDLQKRGVKTDLIRISKGTTGHAIIQVTDQGENSIVLFGGENRNVTTEEINETITKFSAGDYLVLQNEINGTPDIIKKAHKRGMKICLNPAPFSADILSWPLNLVDILIVNETEAMGLVGMELAFPEVINKLTTTYPDTEIIMTAGKQGAYFGMNDERAFSPVRDAVVVDTTAAGDTFLGYYISARMRGLDAKAAMDEASLASSIAVSRPGAMDSIPKYTELQNI